MSPPSRRPGEADVNTIPTPSPHTSCGDHHSRDRMRRNLNMDPNTRLSAAETLRTFGFAIARDFFDAASLGEEIDRVMREGIASQHTTQYEGISFQYVPMMTAETPVSLSLLDRAGVLAEALLGGPVIPTRAKGTRYFGNSP